MLGSFNIARVLGVGVRLHWSFVVFIVVLLVTGFPFGVLRYNLAFLGVGIAIVLLHELGHALVARRFGLQVLDVTLWPLGGFTRMSRIPEDSKIEGWIAFAGPAVNLALASLALFFAPDRTLIDGPLAMQHASRFEFAAGWFVWVNLSLALLNLLPAFPLDGGRLLRALIALRTDWV
ncbi:MAG TPA: site-2 protease family protein, partial [Planctomycetota bacterium]|nr:site-2 protease family protein [Planctomycetota bacterium]